MNKRMYVLRQDNDFDMIRIHSTLEGAIKELIDILKEDYIYLEKEDIQEIKERAKAGFEYPYCEDDCEWSIMQTWLAS